MYYISTEIINKYNIPGILLSQTYLQYYSKTSNVFVFFYLYVTVHNILFLMYAILESVQLVITLLSIFISKCVKKHI